MLNARPEAMAAYLKQAGKSLACGDEFVTKYPKKGSDAVERVEYGPSPQSSPRKRGEEAAIPSPSKGEGKGEGGPGRVHINDERISRA